MCLYGRYSSFDHAVYVNEDEKSATFLVSGFSLGARGNVKFFGAAVAEEGVADFLKVMGLSHTLFLFSNYCFPTGSSINSPGMSCHYLPLDILDAAILG